MSDLPAISRPPTAPPTIALGLLGGILLSHQRRDNGARKLLAVAGLGIIAFAARPLLRDWLVRHGSARRRIRVSTSVEVRRSVADVFAFCKDFENFPRVIGSLSSVTDYQDGRSHWEGYSPSGEIVAWDAVVTKYVPNVVIGWTSVPGSVVQSSGVIRFAATESGARLRIEIVYTPRDTGFGDAIRALAAPSLEAQFRDDLAHAAFYLESLPVTEPVEEPVSGP